MHLSQRYFTLEQAKALLPKVRDVVMDAIRAKERIELKVDDWRTRAASMGPADEAILRGQIDFLAGQLEEKVAKLGSFGVLPKDLNRGLIDFPARIEGREGYYCWMLGEDDISHWHGVTEGFNGRRPIPAPEELYR